MTTRNPICTSCKHFVAEEKKYNKCGAFPVSPGIPWEIVSGQNDHSKPLKNQKNNIVFEKLKAV